MRDNLEAQALIITMKPPTPRFSLSMTAHEMFNTLRNSFEKTTTGTRRQELVHDDDTTRTAARARKAFGGTCRKCGEVRYKAQECAPVDNRLMKLNVKELDEAGVTEVDGNAETTGIEEVEVEFNEIIETAGKEGSEEMAEEASGHKTDAKGLGDEAADNEAASEGPAARNS